MSKLSDYKLKPPRLLFYGNPGTGKTALALSGGDRVMALDVDGGMRTGLTFKDKFYADRLNVEVKDCDETDPERPTSYAKVRSYITSFAREARAGKATAKILVIDSWTSVCVAAKTKVAADNGRVGQRLFQNHWGFVIGDLEALVTIIKTIPAVVIVTAHKMFVNEEDQPDIAKGTVMCYGKKLPSVLVGAFDEVWHTKVKELPQDRVDIAIESQPSPAQMTRSRMQLPKDSRASEGLVALLMKIGHNVDTGEDFIPGAKDVT